MKIYISADIEGITGITSWEETKESSIYFRNQMTREVSAACVGASEGGAKEIVVKDAHDSGRNINPSSLPTNVKIHRGWSGGPLKMMEALDETFDAVMFIGYHSGANQEGNPLAHTFSNSRFQYIKLNGKYVSEYDLNRLTASYFNVPVIFLSGDELLCRAAKDKDPNLTIVSVLESIGNSTVSIHPELSIERIHNGAKEAVEKCESVDEIQMPDLYEFEIMYKEAKDAYKASFYNNVKHIDPKTITFTTDDFYEYLRMSLFI